MRPYRVLDSLMHFVTFHINRAKWPSRAEVLACTAANTAGFIDGGYLHGAVRTFVIDHLDGSRWAMSFAIAAADTVSQNHAVLFNPNSVANMDVRFFFSRDGLDGSSGADLTASCTFGTTVAALKRHDGLHEVHQVGGRTQNIVRATRYAKLTSRAMLLHVTCRDGTWRCDGRFAFRGNLVLNDRQTAIDFHLRLRHGCRCSCYCCCGKESTAFRINGFGFGLSFFSGIMQCIELALVKAITTDYATRIIHSTVLEINGLRLTVLFAHAAAFALVFVETDAEQRVAGAKTECGAHGTDGIAIETPFAPCQERQYY